MLLGGWVPLTQLTRVPLFNACVKIRNNLFLLLIYFEIFNKILIFYFIHQKLV